MIRQDLNLFEVWKPIPGYEGLYEVSSEGRVWSIRRQIIKKTVVNKNNGYEYVSLCSRPKLLHRVVLSAFCENPAPSIYTDVNHKNEIKTDNRVENLEWCNRSYNIRYGTGLSRRKEEAKKTNIKSGRWDPSHFGMSQKEYNKMYRAKHRDYYIEHSKQWRQNKKSI